jgi:hypothetical protein
MSRVLSPMNGFHGFIATYQRMIGVPRDGGTDAAIAI